MGILHVVLFQWRGTADTEAVARMLARLAALRTIAGVEWLEVGAELGLDAARRAEGFSHALVSRHVDAAALARYRADPDHLGLGPELATLAERILVFDFPAWPARPAAD